MFHQPIQLHQISLSFPGKPCFDSFSAHIHLGDRIAIIGRNGEGKSCLLKILQGSLEPTSGSIHHPPCVSLAYVPQIVTAFEDYSGGQRFHQALTLALNAQPNVLLLDEPTNHLDHQNKQSLIRMLQKYQGTMLMVTHDTELMRSCCDTLWHIQDHHIHVFQGQYDHYQRSIAQQRQSTENQIHSLNKIHNSMHEKRMREQQRASTSKARGKKSIAQKKWPTITSHAKACRASYTAGKKQSQLKNKQTALTKQLEQLRLPEIITPTFSIIARSIHHQNLISIREGGVGYNFKNPILNNIHLSINSHDRVAIEGRNGSGKTMLIKAIMGDTALHTTGDWLRPTCNQIGYLDQHYATLNPSVTPLILTQEAAPQWSPTEVRRHLCDFLFRGNERVMTPVQHLSGGEKARLSLAIIAANTPDLLILDEITNNIDLETREHVTQVLLAYPGALIIISHDDDFLGSLDLTHRYRIQDGSLHEMTG